MRKYRARGIKLKTTSEIKSINPPLFDSKVTEVLNKNDRSVNSSEMRSPAMEEVRESLEQGTFKVFFKDEKS